MKQYYFGKIVYAIFLLFYLSGTSQTQIKTQKVVQVLEPQSFYLNGGTRNMFGGNSRTGFLINLPANTIDWYYIFTTESEKNDTQNLQLNNQISFLLSSYGFSSALINLIKVPEGKGLVDIYLTDRKGYDAFFEKDIWGQWKYTSPGHNIEGSRNNAKNGKVQTSSIKKGQHFLVIRNTSATTGVNVKLEVVAITEETTIDYSKWGKEVKDALYNKTVSGLKQLYPDFSDEKINTIAGCIVTKLTTGIKMEDFNELAEYEKNDLLKKYYDTCLENN